MFDTSMCLSLPGCNFICQVDEKDDAHIRFGTCRKKWIFVLVHNSHDSFVDRELSIHVTEWSGTEWRQGGNIGDIDEAIVVRPRRGRRTKKK